MKKILSGFAFFISNSAFAEPLIINCEYPDNRTTRVELTATSRDYATAKYVVWGDPRESYNVTYSAFTGHNAKLHTYTFQLELSSKNLVVSFESDKFEGPGLLNKGAGTVINLDCTRNQIPPRF